MSLPPPPPPRPKNFPPRSVKLNQTQAWLDAATFFRKATLEFLSECDTTAYQAAAVENILQSLSSAEVSLVKASNPSLHKTTGPHMP